MICTNLDIIRIHLRTIKETIEGSCVSDDSSNDIMKKPDEIKMKGIVDIDNLNYYTTILKR